MAVNAVIGTYQQPIPEETIISGHHAPVTRPKKVKTAQGVLDAGLIVALDANGDLVPYDPDGSSPVNEPVGVLLERCDTSKEDTAVVVVHGTVWRERIHVSGAAPSADDLKKLEDIGVWPMP